MLITGQGTHRRTNNHPSGTNCNNTTEYNGYLETEVFSDTQNQMYGFHHENPRKLHSQLNFTK